MNDNVNNYYHTVQTMGSLRTPDHARRWSTAVLKTLGVNLDRKTKKKLAKALPEDLGHDLKRLFWLVHFRNKNMSKQEFQFEVSKRSGNSDWQFAKTPIQAVFHGVKELIDNETNQAVAQSLAPDVRELWQQA
ncbi:MAG: DUF2267 domain-containing protein [Anaerolineae bacterium]|nr:DUF2267 domain-containing protein [Anaerolineae bacterium]